MKTETGQVQYGGRALHQDAMEAMHGDIVRGLIETLTNADDAYGDEKGKIRIEVEHRRRHGQTRVVTRDRATGMSAEELKNRIAHLGGRTSGFESGANVRGNLGRGAKDLVAFGDVIFESIKDDKYAKLTLLKNGRYQLNEPKRATDAIRSDLRISRGNGTVVTVMMDPNQRCPQHEKLRDKLAAHYQLRDILSNTKREVLLCDVTTGREERLRYEYPSLLVALSERLPIPGYPKAVLDVQILRNAERYDGPPSQSGRPHGLLVKGRRAIYENTLFSCESNPYAGWFSGHVKCDFIDSLAADYDDRLAAGTQPDEDNPMPIITRRRDGLHHDHPFYRVMASIVGERLERLVADEEKRSRDQSAGENARMRRALDALGSDLGRLIDEDLRDIEEEGLGGGLGSEGGQTAAIRIIPEQAVAYLGEDKTLTVAVRADLGAESVQVSVDPEGVVELLDEGDVPLVPHRRRTDSVVAQVHVRPLIEDEETMLSVRVADHEAVAIIEVRPERIVEEVEAQIPDSLQFERESYRLSYLKRKQLVLQAPIELIDQYGDTARVKSSDSGVVVLGDQIQLRFDEDLLYYVGELTVDPRRLGSKATIAASLGDASAECKAVVTQEENAPKLIIRIVDEEAGSFRAIVERDHGATVIRVMGRHPAIKRYLGPAPSFPWQESSTAKAMIAEILAGEATRMVMEKRFPNQAGEYLDAAGLYAEHFQYLHKYLQRCHRALVDEGSLELENEKGRSRKKSSNSRAAASASTKSPQQIALGAS